MSCSMLISVTSFRHYCVILVRSLFSPSGLSRISWHQLNRLKSKLRIYETSMHTFESDTGTINEKNILPRYLQRLSCC